MFTQFPHEVQEDIYYALEEAQWGGKAPAVKPLKGFRGAGVLEIIENHDGNAYRVVYTVKFKEAICVLHAFQKKSKRGIQAPRREIRIIEVNLRGLAEHMKDQESAE